MQGQTCLVTGATSGIGAITARALARAGADLFIVGRDPAKTEALVAQLTAETGNARVEALIGDLSRQADVRQVASQFKAKRDRLDRLINNAGAMFTSRAVSDDGFERTWAVNHLAYFLLTTELLPVIEATPGARIISTASDAHRGGRMVFEDLQFERRAYGTGTAAYCQSKLANVLFTRALSRRLKGDTVACAVHPGYVATGFALNNGPLVRALQWLGKPFARSPEKGADTLIWAATEASPSALAGAYLVDRKARTPSQQARDDAAAETLWTLSEAQVAASAPA